MVQYGHDPGDARCGEGAVAGVVQEGVADGAHGFGGVRDDLVGGAGLVGRAGVCLPPVELGDDPAQRGAQLVREFAGELPLVAQKGADAVEYGVQRCTEAGEFGGMMLAAEAFVGGHGAPLDGLVGHRADGAQRAADRQPGQAVGAGEHEGVQGEGSHEQGVG